MNEDQSHEVRLALLEHQYNHLQLQLSEIELTVKEMRDLLLKAKGARWAIAGLAALGGALASLGLKLWPH